MADLSTEDQEKQIRYRDARINGDYDDIWKNVGHCAFCELNDKYVFYEENGVVLTIALYAYVDGHCMIIPRRHVRSVKELTQEEWETVRKFIYLAKKSFRKLYSVKGMQVVQKDGVSAQSTVEHLHIHCIPFDDPELSTWNYKQLENTPLENSEIFNNYKDKLSSLSKRFDEKYG